MPSSVSFPVGESDSANLLTCKCFPAPPSFGIMEFLTPWILAIGVAVIFLFSNFSHVADTTVVKNVGSRDR